MVDAGVPVVVPGGPVVPAPATIVPPPTIESDPQLQALPPAAGAAPGGSASSRNPSGANRSAYEAIKPKDELLASKRGGERARTYRSPAPTQAAYATDQPDILDNLPPVDLPPDVSRKGTPIVDLPPVQIEANPAGKGEEPNPGDAAPPMVPVRDPQTKTTSAEPVSAGVRPVASPGQPNPPDSLRAHLGVDRAANLQRGVVGGSVPGAEALSRLHLEGIKTLVDLRPRGEVEADIADRVLDRGMTYLPLGFAIAPVHATRLDRFNEAVAQAGSNSIYICDGDGRRLGLAWYLHLRAVQHESAASARTKALALGLVEGDLIEAERVLGGAVAATETSDEPAGPRVSWGDIQPSTGAPVPSTVRPPTSTNAAATVVASTPFAPASKVVSVRPIPVLPREERDQPLAGIPSWKPAAALVISGLGVPLAYWSRATLFQKRAPRRASLTAKGPGPRKALPASDA